MLSKLKQALAKLEKKENFYAWEINVSDAVAIQSLLLGQEEAEFEEYQSRKVFDKSYEVTIYSRQENESDNEQVMGSSTFDIDPLAELDAQLLTTFQHSLLVKNQKWDLPHNANEAYEAVVTSDPLIKEDIEKAHQLSLLDINNTVKTLNKVKVNSAELFTNFATRFFETSFGLTGTKETSDIYFEIALEKQPLPNQQEVLKYKKAINLEEAKLGQFIDETVDETLSIRQTTLPNTSNNASILINAESIASLLFKLIWQLEASSEYTKTPFIPVGDKVYTHDKISGSDILNITLDPTIPLMSHSTPFTHEGMKPQKKKIIADDTVVEQIINHKMGQYLHKEANYIAGNMAIEKGKYTKEELLRLNSECIEILSFSSLLVNFNTLTWSSEIKLGRLYKDGKAIAMIKGGVVSGDIRENLANFNFSDTIEKRASQGYQGPAHMLINSGIKIAGETA